MLLLVDKLYRPTVTMDYLIKYGILIHYINGAEKTITSMLLAK